MNEPSLWDRIAAKLHGMNPFAVAGDAVEGNAIDHSALVQALGSSKPKPAGPKPPPPVAPKAQGTLTPEEREIYERQQKLLRGGL